MGSVENSNSGKGELYILFPAKEIMSYSQSISSRLYIRLKGTYSLAARSL